MRVCLVAEKPSLAKHVMAAIREIHPDLEPDAFACAYVNPFIHLNAAFRYPRGLAWPDYPYVGEPEYAPFRFGSTEADGSRTFRTWFDPEVTYVPSRPGMYAYRRWAGPNPSFADPDAEALARFVAADVIYAAIDPGPSSWLALDRFLAHVGPSTRAGVRIPLITDISSAGTKDAFASPLSPDGDGYASRVSRARVRRRFDYAYQVNALAVHGRTLREAGAPPTAQAPSKYGLQALYHLRRAGTLEEGRWIWQMQPWKGTGRYDATPGSPELTVNLGSPASHLIIVKSLARAGLTEPAGPKAAKVSALGHRFLDLLHPGSEDRDLPFRLREWADGFDETEGKARVDRYLRTAFGRQIRFLARNATRERATALKT